MSVTWRPDPPMKPCNHRRCAWRVGITAVCSLGAFLALAWVLIMPCLTAVAVLSGLLTAVFGAALWSCKPVSAEEMEALVDATVEPVYLPSYMPADWPERYGR